MHYRLTDTIGGGDPLTVDADVTTAEIEAWYLPGAAPDDPNWAVVRLSMNRLARSLGSLGASWDEAAAQFLGIRVEVLD